jgi:hypothetical protein
MRSDDTHTTIDVVTNPKPGGYCAAVSYVVIQGTACGDLLHAAVIDGVEHGTGSIRVRDTPSTRGEVT